MSHPPVLSQSGASILVFPNSGAACRAAAERIARVIASSVAERGKAVIGLPTGATPVSVYEHLVELHRAKELSFANVTTFNLDEYYPISPLDPNSYRFYMHRYFFSHVDLDANRAHVLDGTVPESFVSEHTADFDRWIEADGGLDLQLLGIGRNGHIGFNEPADMSVEQALELPTGLACLHPITITDAAKDFGGNADRVPRRALTVGIKPILAARSILVLAFGAGKAEAVARSLDGPLTATTPGSLLQTAGPRVTWLVDEAALARR
jgi:glucosamine-6-phosphate deaminase